MLTTSALRIDAPRLGFAVNGGQYAAVIIYAGACFAFAAAIAAAGWFWDGRSREEKSDCKAQDPFVRPQPLAHC